MKPQSYRHYNPVHAKFISPDPIHFQGGDANLYRYVNNDPTNYVDPSGNLGLPAGGAIAGGFIGGLSGFFNSDACSFTGRFGDAVIGFTGGAIGGFFAGVGAQFGNVAGAGSFFGGLISSGAVTIGGIGVGAGVEIIGQFGPSFSGHGCKNECSK